MKKYLSFLLIVSVSALACNKHGVQGSITINTLNVAVVKINDVVLSGSSAVNINLNPAIRFSFNAPLKRSSTATNIALSANGGNPIPLDVTYTNNDSIITVHPVNPLTALTKYVITLLPALTSAENATLQNSFIINFTTAIDSTDKFPVISDNALLDLVQNQTFKYFWDFGHPVSGLARERNTSGDLITTGGSGFGLMAIITGVNRNFITRTQGLTRMQTIVSFLKNTAQRFHGAYPHWLNGISGAVIPFSPNDNGADLVETSFLAEGLLCVRQYFNGADPAETALRADINSIWNSIEWNWFRQNNQNILYWHWSPNLGWVMNVQLKGWNEALITYVLSASSANYAIPKVVYDNGWASSGSMVNNNTYYGYQLPLGPALGGPLFFEHYSFMGINPNGLNDVYANYQLQAVNHTKINYEYCKANPRGYYGYSNLCWGLTASDIQGGYTASSPTNDVGVIAPTAALSSFPYTPIESIQALKFFYYKLGDKTWGPYGFYDSFNLSTAWFANSYLAIDQGPIIVMMENYRSGLLWNLFTSCPEVKNGMRNLGFTAPYL